MTSRAFKRVRDRLEHWLELATASQRAEGKQWYGQARGFAEEVSRAYDLPIERVIGVIAALSPSVYWAANKLQAEALCRAHADGEDLDAVVLTTYGIQVKKAHDVLETPATAVRGVLGRRAFKTQNFYDNMLYPWADTQAVTIDQHIIDAAGFSDYWVYGARWCYNLLADAIREIAIKHGMLPCQVQAIIWITYKELTDSKHPAERRQAEPEENLPF